MTTDRSAVSASQSLWADKQDQSSHCDCSPPSEATIPPAGHMSTAKSVRRQDSQSFNQQWMGMEMAMGMAMGTSGSTSTPHPFGYIPLPPDGLTSDSDHNLNNNSILSNQESQYLGTFLDTTDFFKSIDMNIKQEPGVFDGSVRFGDSSHMLSGRDGSSQPAHFRSHPQSTSYYSSAPDQMSGAYDDSSAAHSLMGLSTHQQPLNAMSWGTFTVPTHTGALDDTASFTPTTPQFNANDMHHGNGHYNRTTGYAPHQQIYHRPASQHESHSTPMGQPHYQNSTSFFHFGHAAAPTNPHGSNSAALEARFGTDNSFGTSGFRGAPGSDVQQKYNNLINIPLAGQVAGYSVAHLPAHSRGGEYDDEEEVERPMSAKRRKTKAEADDDDDYVPSNVPAVMPKRGSKVARANEDKPATPGKNGGPRRKSSITGGATQSPSVSSPYVVAGSPNPTSSTSPGDGADTSSVKKRQRARGSDAGAASSRQNLSDAQKRENHIRSEQKRRNIIKQGYNDLNRMVPSLTGGRSGLSKADVLKEAIMYLEECIVGNKAFAHLLPSAEKSGDAAASPAIASPS